MEEVNLYLATDLKGPRRAAGKGMYLLECVTSKGTQTRNGTVRLEDATENQLTVSALEEALKRINRPVSLTIWTDCQYAGGAILNKWPEKWEKEDWKNAKGEPISDAEKWQSILVKLRIHEVSVRIREHHAYSSWLKAELKKE